MNRIAIATACAVLAAFPLAAQKPAKSPQATAAKSSDAARAESSNQERNIRAYIELLRSDVKNQKTQVTGAVMQLDAAQSAVFWPIYKDFEKDLSTVGDQVVALVKEYAANYDSMTDEVADQLVGKLLAIEQQRLDLKKQYYERFKRALDAITAARFVQVENQLERLVDLQIASELPVVE
jgi:hypothetical protein